MTTNSAESNQHPNKERKSWVTLVLAVTAAVILAAPMAFAPNVEASPASTVAVHREVSATGNGKGSAEVCGGGTCVPNTVAITFEWHSEYMRMCDGTEKIKSAKFTVKGGVNGIATDGTGTWNYLGLQFVGEGGPGFVQAPPDNSPLFSITAHPSMSGELDLSPLGTVGVMTFSFAADGGSATGKSSHYTGTCNGDGSAFSPVALDLSGVCESVMLDFHWREVDTPDKHVLTVGYHFFETDDDVPTNAGDVYRAKGWSGCTDPRLDHHWNSKVTATAY